MHATAPVSSEVDPSRRQARGGRFYHPELDVLRFFAFFMVFLGHSNFDMGLPFWAGHVGLANLWLAIHGAGFSGVCLFFALSSYLITELLLKEQDVTERVSLRDFYLRRILRIWPLYFFFLLLVRPIAARFLVNEHFSGAYLTAYLLLAGNWQCYFHGWPASVAAPLWSISIEEQFYLAWPVMVSRLRRHIPAIAVMMLLVANLTRITLSFYPTGDPGVWANTFTRLDPFALGALVAFYLHGREVKIPGFTRVLLVALGAVLLMILGRYGGHVAEQGLFFYPIEAFACALLLLAVLRPMGNWTPSVVGKALVYLGRISYGLYVYHLLCLTLMGQTHLDPVTQKLCALALTIAVASLSYRLIEEPFLRLKARFTHVRSRP